MNKKIAVLNDWSPGFSMGMRVLNAVSPRMMKKRSALNNREQAPHKNTPVPNHGSPSLNKFHRAPVPLNRMLYDIPAATVSWHRMPGESSTMLICRNRMLNEIYSMPVSGHKTPV